MIRFALLIVILLTGLVAGPMLAGQKGYVLIALDHWTIEMSVISLGLTLLFGIVAFLLLEWLVKRLLTLLTGSRRWLGGWSERKRQKAFTRGLVALEEANYQEAEKQLSRVDSAAFNGLDLLASAQAAAKRKQWDKARELWMQARAFPASELAATLHLVKLEIQQQQAAEALQLLEALSEKHQQHPRVALLWAKALAHAGRWHELQDRLKGWKKTLGLEKYDFWMRQAAQGVFAEIASKEGANQLKLNWQGLPRAKRQDPAHQAAYAEQLMEQGMHQDAEQVLVEGQKQGPHPLLLPLFKKLRSSNPVAAMRKLEEWLKKDEQNAELLSALGHLAKHTRDFSLAEKALTKALSIRSSQDDLLALAEIKEAQQDNKQALALYKQSLQLNP
ncbi:heme biosynthesis HemY N-terminal domain-containing protein [Bowmanella denitrificans]|uniref:heme biosynthesis HemY N-terminal domain-containing protein n=1 Tax=Bowmanella denitrificans TaxID=366582 RepID=UPI000C9C787A|nr:heme biosynthesis HemY N-terminal domain-containing protein [Bowmanella denitrificans]